MWLKVIVLPPFDHFIAVDWSSRAKPSPAKPSRDAIWLAQSTATGRTSVKYFRTRQACLDYLEARLIRLARKGKRVLVGWDFSFGYPKGLAKALRLRKNKKAWLRIWELIDRMIVDEADNYNNRFAVGAELNRRISLGSGPFWGVPTGQSGIFLGSRKDFTYPVMNTRVTLPEKRLVEERVPRMQPAWKLAYTGSVGSQTLLGIPGVLGLAKQAEHLNAISRVWPFDTDFGAAIPLHGACILHAEIYPSLLSLAGKDKIIDREQVKTYVKWLRDEQSAGRLSAWLAGPADLTKRERKQVLRHEGWVLGVL